MSPVTIRMVLDDRFLGLPELSAFAGKEVEIVVRESDATDPLATETRETLLGPHCGAAPPMSRERLKLFLDDPRYERFRPLLETCGDDFLDIDAIVELRAKSMI